MQNASPLLLTLILAGTALFLSLREKETVAPKSAPTPKEEVVAKASEPEPPAPIEAIKPQVTKPLATAWPHATSDIPSDPKAVYGTLENGFRYMILPNSEPPNRLSMRLHVAAGSLMEEDDQRGLAHFLEHMVFNGTKNFQDANALIREMQTRGIGFGAHVNAYTSFDETVYMLDLPNTKPDNMDLSFRVIRDFSDGALLSIDEIDAERGVILAEKASRDSVDFRMMEKQFSALLPDSLISKRFPIGVEEVISKAQRQRFVDFYQKFYIPRLMTFVVVGDVDIAEIEKRIKDSFGSMINPEQAQVMPKTESIETPKGIQPHVFTDSELSTTEVSLSLLRPYQLKPDTRQSRAQRFPIEIAHSILSHRFERLSKQENSPISEGSVSKFTLFNQLELGSFSLTAAEERWQDAVPVLEQEFRRALQYGFMESELNQAKANLLNAYQEAVESRSTRKSESLATAIAGSVNDALVFSTPEHDLELAKEILNQINAQQVHEEFVKFWNNEGYHLVLSTKSAPNEAADTLAALFQDSKTKEVSPPAERVAEPFGYTEFGQAGDIKQSLELIDLNVNQIKLANNVFINLKKTDFEKNRIHMSARIGSGQLSQPSKTPMLDNLASALFNGGGLGKHDVDQLTEILAGRNVSATLSIQEDAFILSGSTTPKDQLLQLQLMIAFLTDPAYRPEALWQFQKDIPTLLQKLKHTPSGPMNELQAWLHGDDFRYSLATQEQLSNYSIDQVKKWLSPELKSGYLELSIVGDFDKTGLTQDLLNTFGTLPKRSAKAPAANLSKRQISFPKPPSTKTFSYESKIPQAIATAIWQTKGLRGNTSEFRRLNILAAIYDDRLREQIREKLGASYSPNAGASGSEALMNHGYLLGQSAGKPSDMPLLLETMEAIATELAENGATQDELDRALAPALSSLEKSLRDNSYWLTTVLSQSQADPSKIDLARSRQEDYRSIQLSEINQLAKQYFSSNNLHKITIQPKEK